MTLEEDIQRLRDAWSKFHKPKEEKKKKFHHKFKNNRTKDNKKNGNQNGKKYWQTNKPTKGNNGNSSKNTN